VWFYEHCSAVGGWLPGKCLMVAKVLCYVAGEAL